MAGGSLKQRNAVIIGALLLLNLATLQFALTATDLSFASFIDGLKAGKALKFVLPMGVLGGIVTMLPNSKWKARAVFWRWSHPLPGAYAFTHHMQADPRVDAKILERKLGTIPTDPDRQNAIWYKLYKANAEDTAVLQNHGEYLLYRDYSAMALMFLLAAPAAYIVADTAASGGFYGAFTVAQYLVARTTATNAGIRFVTTVLATTAAKVS